MPGRSIKAKFIDPMLLLSTEMLPAGDLWLYELKLDGFRAEAVKTGGKVLLRSRNDKDFNRSYPTIVRALRELPDETVIDGEIVALDESGRPSFTALQDGSGAAALVYFIFDVMVFQGKDLTSEPLAARREVLKQFILPSLAEPVRHPPEIEASLPQLIESVRAQGLEGLVAKRRDSRYEAGQRSGAWQKMRVNQGQNFVIGGYTASPKNFDALVFGYFESGRLMYAGRTRSGFTPASRDQVFRRFQQLEIKACPFVNLPEMHAGRWGQGLTAEKMRDCRWLEPVLVARFEFVEWTPEGHLRHSRFMRLQEGAEPRNVVRRAKNP